MGNELTSHAARVCNPSRRAAAYGNMSVGAVFGKPLRAFVGGKPEFLSPTVEYIIESCYPGALCVVGSEEAEDARRLGECIRAMLDGEPRVQWRGWAD